MASDGRMTDERGTGKDLKGSDCGLSRRWPGLCLQGLRKTTKVFRQDSRCPDRDSNRKPKDYKSVTLPLDQNIQYEQFIILIKNRIFKKASVL
jgi:hypothetical protein